MKNQYTDKLDLPADQNRRSLNEEDEDISTVDAEAREAVESLDGYQDWVKEIRSEREGLNFGDW